MMDTQDLEGVINGMVYEITKLTFIQDGPHFLRVKIIGEILALIKSGHNKVICRQGRPPWSLFLISAG